MASMTSAADAVEQRDAGRGHEQRAEVRVAAADGRGGVDHRAGPGLHERLGRHAVEVVVVDDRDLARLDAG